MLADQFAQIFRQEHRNVRDALLDLILAFQARDRERIQALLNRVAVLTGPHFRYEEEALYPALVEIFGEEYVEKLWGDHDRAIGIAQSLVSLAGKEQLTDQDITRATQLIRRVLPHVSDCDGLSIMVERLPTEKVQRILDTREHSNAVGLNLLQWADQVRGRPIVTPD